jgi:hypothetical protein
MKAQKGIRGALSLTSPIDGLGGQGHNSVVSRSSKRQQTCMAYTIAVCTVKNNRMPEYTNTQTLHNCLAKEVK